MKLFIDDIRQPPDNTFDVVRSFDDAVAYMKSKGCPDYISFDHDLGDAQDGTGFTIAKWMVNHDLDEDGKFIPKDFEFNVHSANPIGSDNIIGLLDNYLSIRKIYESAIGLES